MSEGPPIAPREEKEVVISDAACIEAMRQGDFEMASKWYAQQEAVVDADPSPHGRLQLTVRLARLQFESGAVDADTGELYAFATLEAAREDAYQRYDEKAVTQIDDILGEMRGGQS